MKGLREKGLVEPIKIAVKSNIPLLGICLGMQLFMSQSQEFGLHYGLDLIKGRVVRFKQSEDKKIYYKIPHVGWNKLLYPCRNNQRQRHLECLKEDNPWQSTILEDLEEGSFVYFVHSYFVVPDKQENILAVTEYGNDVFCSVVASGNILGCQFHPERSGDAGLSIYRKFIFNNFS
jgi:glutamine amidotransferase